MRHRGGVVDGKPWVFGVDEEAASFGPDCPSLVRASNYDRYGSVTTTRDAEGEVGE